MNDSRALLSVSYFGPIQYFCKFLFPEVVIEHFENYGKQSYRNRCVIYGANGPMILAIPIKKNHGKKTLIKDIEIDYETNWQKNHRRSIESAYRSAPFFEFYFDEFLFCFEKKFRYLFDLDLQIIESVCECIELAPNISLSKHYIVDCPPENDFRDSIHPKKRMQKPDPHFQLMEYNQIFIEKYGFISNLSILDLIFNQGPESLTLLKSSNTRNF